MSEYCRHHLQILELKNKIAELKSLEEDLKYQNNNLVSAMSNAARQMEE